eukprot:11175927-Lingulodinium_polyedra.AAC.1
MFHAPRPVHCFSFVALTCLQGLGRSTKCGGFGSCVIVRFKAVLLVECMLVHRCGSKTAPLLPS